MARPREFDLEETLDKAMRLFWDVGFEEASLNGLLDTMGISKGSFYKAFQDKKSVYLAALDRYNTEVIDNTVSFLASAEAGEGPGQLIGLFRKVEAEAHSNGDRLGCFLCNALVDRANADPEVEDRLQAMVLRLENAFAKALLNHRHHSARLAEEAARQAARGLLSIYLGMRVLGRGGLAIKMVSDCVQQAEKLIAATLSESGGRLP